MARKAAKQTPMAPLGQIGVRYEGLERDRMYTREDLCRHFGYNPEAVPVDNARSATRNRDRWFRDNMLSRGLPALPVGKTYLISGESLWLWVTANARKFDETRAGSRSPGL
ncbi:hypothetical protein [Lacipirellula parvula]|uniref:Uncharacterized protein n=1 Tax=Lacipirellula parvula TaxID=2650471 RepID=A0A5K7X6V9_9BACT|nr:hypothetical protein [Lacipirellula parvula]BBO32105.1 hypothetical protein PLANPX_1717 [Lacipirellula parvula]